jgi:hypothetical protein
MAIHAGHIQVHQREIQVGMACRNGKQAWMVVGIQDFNVIVQLRKNMPHPFPEERMIVGQQYFHGFIGIITLSLQGETQLFRAAGGADL